MDKSSKAPPQRRFCGVHHRTLGRGEGSQPRRSVCLATALQQLPIRRTPDPVASRAAPSGSFDLEGPKRARKARPPESPVAAEPLPLPPTGAARLRPTLRPSWGAAPPSRSAPLRSAAPPAARAPNRPHYPALIRAADGRERTRWWSRTPHAPSRTRTPRRRLRECFLPHLDPPGLPSASLPLPAAPPLPRGRRPCSAGHESGARLGVLSLLGWPFKGVVHCWALGCTACLSAWGAE